MNVSYQTVKLRGGDVFLGPEAREGLAKVDAVVFDCDGTLIDVRKSYDATITRTVTTLTKGFLGASVPLDGAGGTLILEMRRTGGFNSDWDITYGLTVFSVLAAEDGPKDGALRRLEELVLGFSSKERPEGWPEVDRYLDGSGLKSRSLGELRKYLGYPGNALSSRLAATFDQLYYGEKLYRGIYGAEPMVDYKRGLIDNEKVIVTKEGLRSIQGMVGEKRMALATGRPYVAVEHTIGDLLGFFRRDASVFIGDGDIHPDMAPKLAKFRKPSGESLLLARRRFPSKVLLYVGDSAEDRLMVENAGTPDGTMLFAGIYGSSFDEKAQVSYFTGTGSDLVVRNVNQVAEVLEMVKR